MSSLRIHDAEQTTLQNVKQVTIYTNRETSTLLIAETNSGKVFTVSIPCGIMWYTDAETFM